MLGGCVFVINPSNPPVTGTEPNQAQESRAAEVNTYSPSVTSAPAPAEPDTDTQNAAQQSEWPQIDGLVLQNGIYYYAENNRFDEEPGYIAGYVNPNVFVNGRQTGAICMQPVACLTLMEDATNQIPSGQVKLKVVVPLDIANFDGRVDIGEMSLYPAGGGSLHQVLSVSCIGSVNILDTINHGTLTAWEFKLSTGETLRSVVSVEAYNNFNRDLAFKNIIISSNGTDLKEYRQGVTTEYGPLAYGELIAKKDRDSVIYLDFVTTELPCVLTVDDLLMVDGKVVFINEYVW